MILAIINRAGTVHQFQYPGALPCPAVSQSRETPMKITTLQALVYQLPPCGDCWPAAADYDRHIGRTHA